MFFDPATESLLDQGMVYFGDVPNGSVFEQDADALIARIVQRVAGFPGEGQVLGLWRGNTVLFPGGSLFFFEEFRIHRIGLQADFQQSAFNDPAAEFRQNAVGVVCPVLDGTHYIVIIESTESLQILLRVECMVGSLEEIIKVGSRGTNLHTGTDQFFCPTNDAHHGHFGTHHRLVQVYLPVHESSAEQKLLDAVDGLFFYHQFAFLYGEHFQDAVVSDYSFCNAREEAVAIQVVHSVYIQLARNQLMQESLRVFVGEDIYGCLQRALEMAVHLLHDQ